MTNFENHNIHTRQINNLQLSPVDLTTYQQDVQYAGTKPFKSYP